MRWEVPRSTSKIHNSLRLACYYQRVMQDFSNIVVPLTRLTNKTFTFRWGPKQQVAFETLRQRLCEALILTLPEDVDDFMFYCDVSITILGAVLMQKGRVA